MMADDVGLNSVTMAPPFQTHLFEPSPSSTSPPLNQPLQSSSRSSTTSGPNNSTGGTYEGSWSWEHFPSSFRTGRFAENVEVLNEHTLNDFFNDEFSLRRLDDIEPKLWRVGYPRAPRCLTTQLQLGRNIVLTKALDMHLIWDTGKIFIKPLPRYLLEDACWGIGGLSQEIRKNAVGFLYTYACLITHPEDFRIALEKNLLPKDDAGNDPKWASWRAFATEVLRIDISEDVHQRFRRGELRLDRLNWIYALKDLPFPSIRLYNSPWQNYTDFVTSNLSWVTATTVYIAVVLTAMQVGLATDALKDNATFHRASYGFTVFSILCPIIAAVLILLALLVFLIPNWIRARKASLPLR
ncbi:uncharacterized protein F4812DRAFT_354601 [Daldinia caldariorum]|uniref:uncharacterized protein n=1 Tax=Daldinia caldariorum TaxID=326644 RepID=UPI002007E874|nr:uncharacterized protein F4812DRAFT_354601 [Daldinia caldariorum]KAI1469024.1 hypothetical protein F4812DRAFT_354601 [Daldinia caldariorum]